MKFKSIVAAIDAGDDLATAVILAADSLARHDGAALHVVSAWPTLPTFAPGFPGEFGADAARYSKELRDADNEARKKQEAALGSLARARNPLATVAVIVGDPGDVAPDYAEKVGADLIVAGSHQRGFWDALFSGASSREVVRNAPCGVFLVTKPFAEKLLAQDGC
ncbi:MAG: universal stress protein [Amphiplicatus sp.]